MSKTASAVSSVCFVNVACALYCTCDTNSLYCILNVILCQMLN